MSKSLGEIDDWLGNHVTEEVIEIGDRVFYNCNDLWMRVTKNGAHLARREVEDLAIVGIIQRGPFGTFDDDG